MINSIATRLIALFIGLMIVILLVFSWFVTESSRQNQQQASQSLHRELAKNMIKENQLLRDSKIDPVALEHLFHSMMLLGPAFEIYVIDLTGHVLAFSAAEGIVKRKTIAIEPIKHFIAGQIDMPFFGDDPRHASRQKIFSAANIYYQEQHQGYLYVIIGSQLQDVITDSLYTSHVVNHSIAIFVGSLLFALITSIVIILFITKPLRALSQQVKGYHRDEGWREGRVMSTKINHDVTPAGNEVAQLNDVINAMATTISQQFEQLASIDHQRKELLSYISHDLRTPLASLTGYLETWLAQQTEQNEQGRYIDIALKNARTLSNLVEQVFELAHLETGSVELNREPIAVAELSQDIIESFRFRAEQAGVTLAVNPKDNTIQVDADIAKLERVLGNLVGNAIRHTPAGGRIEITFEQITINHCRRILIKVTDTGVGIPSSALPRVFEAHFRASNKRDGESSNAGLGLAIVKALLELHQSEIKVTSVEHQGTTFSFSLPQYMIS
ncbi:MAG: HAMP domain-containing histidine kinase [Gammaproteobacteria bacterium]|nr:HAMP domain-containing histidine kinase [Gammaproteobacteria bacterium]